MRKFRENDYVIWQRKKLCQVVRRLPPKSGPLFGGAKPPPGTHLDIKPYGLTKEEWAELKDDIAMFLLLDLDTETEFEAEGYDLLGPVNAMEVLAMMARKDGEGERPREGDEGGGDAPECGDQVGEARRRRPQDGDDLPGGRDEDAPHHGGGRRQDPQG